MLSERSTSARRTRKRARKHASKQRVLYQLYKSADRKSGKLERASRRAEMDGGADEGKDVGFRT